MADPIVMMTRPAGLKIALALPMAAAALTGVAIAAAAGQWRDGLGTRAARLRYDAVVIASVLFLWSLSRWNLLGWRL